MSTHRQFKQKCTVCGKYFIACTRRFCSANCRSKVKQQEDHKRKLEIKRICVSCGSEFHSVRTQKYCSSMCRPSVAQQHDIRFRLRNALLGQVRHLFGATKVPPVEELIGCSMDAFMNHLENQFEIGMAWANYGEWQIDHIRPLVSFDLTLLEHQQIVSHYTNLRPLWGVENARRNSLLQNRSLD